MSVNIYPVQPSQCECSNYSVKVNGEEIALNSARVSTVPFNRRWPGHQRQIEQTELINFASFECEGETVLEITPKGDFDDFVIRPQSLNFKAEKTADGTIKIIMTKPAYFVVEPFGRQNALHIFADPIYKYTTKENEDVIYFGAGVHDAGTIELKSNQTLFIDEGALVYGSVHAEDAENIRIIGRGILDNSKNKEKILFDVNAVGNTMDVRNSVRTHTIKLDYCTNIEIDGITMRDSLVYNIKPSGCKNINIKNIKIIGCWRFNSDGIDMHNCEDVHISDCFIRTFDDSICVKGFDFYSAEDIAKATWEATHHNGKVYDTFKNVLVERCVIWNDWGKCLEIGAETKAEEMCNIHFKDCDVIHSSIAVLTCSNGDYAHIHDVIYENINIEYEENVLQPAIQSSDSDKYVSQDPDYSPIMLLVGVYFFEEYSRGVVRRGTVNDITFKNINLYARQKPAIEFVGYDAEHKCKNIVIDGLYQNGQKITDLSQMNCKINEFVEGVCIK